MYAGGGGLQERQKKEAAAVNGKGIKQSAGELRLQKGRASWDRQGAWMSTGGAPAEGLCGLQIYRSSTSRRGLASSFLRGRINSSSSRSQSSPMREHTGGFLLAVPGALTMHPIMKVCMTAA